MTHHSVQLRKSPTLVVWLVAGLWASAACSSGTSPATPAASGGVGGGAAGANAAAGDTTGGSAGAAIGGASGAASGGAAAGVASLCDGAGTKLLSSDATFIDDFEGAAISPGWSSFNDVMPAHDVFKIMQVPGGAAGTAHSGHYTGTGAIVTTAGGFGVGTVYNVAIDPAAGIYCIDISAFDGVSFWAKAATDSAKISLNFVLPETNAVSMDAMMRQNGGDCLTGCFNHPQKALSLTVGWAQYSVKFSDAGGGSAKVSNRIQELAWLSPDSDWDFSLDEVAFYKGTPAPGAVGAASGAAGAPGN